MGQAILPLPLPRPSALLGQTQTTLKSAVAEAPRTVAGVAVQTGRLAEPVIRPLAAAPAALGAGVERLSTAVAPTLATTTQAVVGGAVDAVGVAAAAPARIADRTSAMLATAPRPVPAGGQPFSGALAYSSGGDFAQIVSRQMEGLEGAVVETPPPVPPRQTLIARHPNVLEADDKGAPVLKGEILVLSPTPQDLAIAAREGFRVKSRADLGELGVAIVVLQAPEGLSSPDALNRIRRLDPAGTFDFNHLYADAGAVGGRAAAPTPAAVRGAGSLRVGLIDGGVDVRHPSLARARVERRAFAPGGFAPSPHGLAAASLLVGDDGRFRSAAPGATLYAADVYGPTPAGGSAAALASAFGWMAQNRVAVINVSLVGPSNAVLKAAVAAMVARGYLVVAAVGNDGPAAPPLYPASYPGVVAVTGVNAQRRVLPEAGRGLHVDFAAPGADMAAAGQGGYVAVRGTSFSAPLVAGRLARRLTAPDPAKAKAAVRALGREATDLGAPGVDPVYGRGLVAGELAVSPLALASAR